MMGPPVFLEHVFPPELVMHYQSELALTPTQQETMTKIMAETQAKLVELQWKYEAATQTLTKLMEKDTVDEEAVLAQWAQLSGVEQQIKRTHLSLLFRIKTQLTPSQQEQLRALRNSEHLRGTRKRRRGYGSLMNFDEQDRQLSPWWHGLLARAPDRLEACPTFWPTVALPILLVKSH
jgi:Spy/CpxP family protein refolding chaperone